MKDIIKLRFYQSSKLQGKVLKYVICDIYYIICSLRTKAILNAGNWKLDKANSQDLQDNQDNSRI